MNGLKISHPLLDEVEETLKPNEKLSRMFRQCFYNTLETTVERTAEGETYIITGDIDAMWLRDSSAQVNHYLPFLDGNPELSSLIRGLIRRQFRYIALDPYANAFNREANGRCYRHDETESSPWVWERKYEIDSLAYPVRLLYQYIKITGDQSILDLEMAKSIAQILDVWRTEQHHGTDSSYRFLRRAAGRDDVLAGNGHGAPVNDTGMTWAGFRPSDDACRFGFNIPGNLFAATALGYIGELAEEVLHDGALAASAQSLRLEILEGVRKYGVTSHPNHGELFAYETDGFGNNCLMDDANVPSLLSLPYLGCCEADDPLYQNTRRFLLSRDNPYYYEGTAARGVGSPHTPAGCVWPIALSMQGLTSSDPAELRQVLSMLGSIDDGAGFMHESVDANDPSRYTRPWFAWANSLFAEFIVTLCRRGELSEVIQK